MLHQLISKEHASRQAAWQNFNEMFMTQETVSQISELKEYTRSVTTFKFTNLCVQWLSLKSNNLKQQNK